MKDNNYFRPLGDLDNKETAVNRGEQEYFVRAGNLDEAVSKQTPEYFTVAGDLDASDIKMDTSKEINDYLLTVVSGKRYEPVCELGVLMGGGRMIVNLEELKNLVDTGHNIVFANVINAEKGLIEVEVQKYVYDEELMEKRSRF